MANDTNMHGHCTPRRGPQPDAQGRPVRPSAEPHNTPPQPDNVATRAAALGFRDPRLEN